jgi:(1->4)-alpha-D-glucan 1-alpha-D-glucosylmutase
VTYGNRRFPLRIESYPDVLEHCLACLQDDLGSNHAAVTGCRNAINGIRKLPDTASAERSSMMRQCKQQIHDLYETDTEFRSHLDRTLERFNGSLGDPSSYDLLDGLLRQQRFRLALSQVAAEDVNYRRFFTVNSLICLRLDRQAVFDGYHRLVVSLIQQGSIAGLRIDHVDGLYDPGPYLENLRAKAPGAYVVVEKILAHGETLPGDWPVQGTTGYDFLNQVNALLCDSSNEESLNRIYASFAGTTTPYRDIMLDSKRMICDRYLTGSIRSLACKAKQLASHDRHARDLTLLGLRHALAEVMTCLSVYRTYASNNGRRDGDRHYINEAVDEALGRNPDHTYELEFLRRVLLLDVGTNPGEGRSNQLIDFVMKLQQLTGSVMAKGFEDTVLYVYNRLLSLNEVGGRPDALGISAPEFHDFNSVRLAATPHTLNATSTHDTKRGEDVRARLNVLSELPVEWDRCTSVWSKINYTSKLQIHGLRVPDKNDEYFLYQTLVGAFPFDEADLPEFVHRLRQYIVKAVREAKVYTGWSRPDSQYENALILFVERILRNDPGNRFLEEFLPFQRMVAHYGMLNSLSQTLLKITAPGVPDFYQGSELWNLSLVDPDNRRPVDFVKRMAYLDSIKQGIEEDVAALVAELLSNPGDGRVKMYLIHRSLDARRRHENLFAHGQYVPLEVKGKYAAHAVSFARMLGGRYAITVAPRLLTGVVENNQLPLGRSVWDDTSVVLPEGFPTRWGNVMAADGVQTEGTMFVGDVLDGFPAGLIVGGEGVS